MDDRTKQKLSRAKALIKRKRYQQALDLLHNVEHPLATTWKKKLKRRLSAPKTTQDTLKHRQNIRAHLKKAKKLIAQERTSEALDILFEVNHPEASKMIQEIRDDITRSKSSSKASQGILGVAFMSVMVFLCAGIFVLNTGGIDTSSVRDSQPTSEPAIEATVAPPTALPIRPTRPPVRLPGLRNQVYDYSQSPQSSSGNRSSSSSGTNWSCSGNIYDCRDFSTRSEMLSYFNSCPGDPSNLDGDDDGRPCEDF